MSVGHFLVLRTIFIFNDPHLRFGAIALTGNNNYRFFSAFVRQSHLFTDAERLCTLIPQATLPRYLAMLKMFSTHYWDALRGQTYPPKLDNVPALLTTYERQVLYRTAGMIPANGHIVEIGSFKGGSTTCFAEGAQNTVTIHSIDTFQTENVQGQEGTDTLQIFQQQTAPYHEKITIHQGFSYDVHEQIDMPIDLLFVDGDHSFEGVMTDLRLYLPKMRPNSILVMHDSAHPPIRHIIETAILSAETAALARLPNLYAGRINPQAVDLSDIPPYSVHQ